MPPFEGDKDFPIDTYKSDIINDGKYKYRCYIFILPQLEELFYIDACGEFDNAINSQISKMLATDVGEIQNNVFVEVDSIKDSEDLDFILILYVKQYTHTFKHSMVILKREVIDACDKYSKLEVCGESFINNIDRFNLSMNFIGHFTGKRLLFTMSYSDKPVNKESLKEFMSNVLRM